MTKKYSSYNKDFFVQDEFTEIQTLPFIFHYTETDYVPYVLPGTLFMLVEENISGQGIHLFLRPVTWLDVENQYYWRILDAPVEAYPEWDLDCFYICLDRIENNQHTGTRTPFYTEWGNFLVKGSINWDRILYWKENRYITINGDYTGGYNALKQFYQNNIIYILGGQTIYENKLFASILGIRGISRYRNTSQNKPY